MSDKDAIKLGLQYAVDSRKAEIALLWSRSLYFWGLIAVLLGAYGAAFQTGHKILATFAGCFGFLCSLSWALANRSSKHWQEVWEKKTEKWEAIAADNGVLYECLFHPDTNKYIHQRWFWGAKPYSPSKLSMAISDFSVIGWVLLVTGAIISRFIQGNAALETVAAIIGTVVAIVLTTAGAALLLSCSRTGRPMGWQAAWIAMMQLPGRITRWFSDLKSS